MFQSSSPSKQKYSMPIEASLVVGDHPRAPGLEVLDAQDRHAGLVDVDPVVREQVLALDHQQHGQELAVAQAAGGVADLDRRLRLGDADRRAQRQRGDHVGGGQRLAAGDAPR